jgi:thiamine-phosphate pyrophosphorylase
MPFRQSPSTLATCAGPLRRVPQCWLMTDQRGAASLIAAIRRLPPRSAVVVRPNALMPAGRPAMLRRIRRTARARRHLLLVTAPHTLAGYDGLFGGSRQTGARAFAALPVHNPREAAAAKRLRATVVFISPVYATRSHPGAPYLAMRGFARLARGARRPAIAMGGMNARRFVGARRNGATGWAAIDAWIRPQD